MGQASHGKKNQDGLIHNTSLIAGQDREGLKHIFMFILWYKRSVGQDI